ncbi:MAG: hypothetical protein ACRCXT_08365 [Paraclostridium sp.]
MKIVLDLNDKDTVNRLLYAYVKMYLKDYKLVSFGGDGVKTRSGVDCFCSLNMDLDKRR